MADSTVCFHRHTASEIKLIMINLITKPLLFLSHHHSLFFDEQCFFCYKNTSCIKSEKIWGRTKWWRGSHFEGIYHGRHHFHAGKFLSGTIVLETKAKSQGLLANSISMCTETQSTFPPADTNSRFMKSTTNMSLCITAQNLWFTFRVKRTLRFLTRKKPVTQCLFTVRQWEKNQKSSWKKGADVECFRLLQMSVSVQDVHFLWNISTNIFLQICIRARHLEQMMTTITDDSPRWIIY